MSLSRNRKPFIHCEYALIVEDALLSGYYIRKFQKKVIKLMRSCKYHNISKYIKVGVNVVHSRLISI